MRWPDRLESLGSSRSSCQSAVEQRASALAASEVAAERQSDELTALETEGYLLLLHRSRKKGRFARGYPGPVRFKGEDPFRGGGGGARARLSIGTTPSFDPVVPAGRCHSQKGPRATAALCWQSRLGAAADCFRGGGSVREHRRRPPPVRSTNYLGVSGLPPPQVLRWSTGRMSARPSFLPLAPACNKKPAVRMNRL